ncbi:MAG TPA: GatB/YqeY domain-containing protein [Anaerolineae bacterium]|nr:GatB/YqeY domain-containing protein [Anaerolineae bacterium]HID84030.1 GatB/YqeY domain-containing protein [Anaerolineales bacterium]HIQ08019.1 GatB/YqeY domain-containing protein [Anaerolineaceae bacterium]
MSVKEQLQKALTQAMRRQDTLRKRVLRLALSAIKLAEVEKGHPLTDTEAWAVLQKEVKARHETIEGAEQAGRQDLIDEARAEITVLEEFLPTPLTPEELEALAREVIAEVGAASPKDMGKVMKPLLAKVQGRASGSEVSQVVRRLLAEG